MHFKSLCLSLGLLFGIFQQNYAQIVINEGCNKNYIGGIDEDGENEDWIEIYNAGVSTVDLTDYTLSDKLSEPEQWPLSGLVIAPDEYKQIFCSEKDRYQTAPFLNAVNDLDYSPVVGWNTHNFTSTFEWDGVSNLVLNICSYLNTGYTENAIFLQTATPYVSTAATFNDGSDASCYAPFGATYSQRPNLKINDIILDYGTIQNSNTDYPAPYGNWYWSARHQILIHASELIEAGIVAGPINSIGFQVVSTNAIVYTYIDISINATTLNDLTGNLFPLGGYLNHTNFKIDSEGETVYLFDPAGINISSLNVASPQADVSIGLTPDASEIVSWMSPSPGMSNNSASLFTDTLKSPIISVATGIFTSSFYLSINNPNPEAIATKIVYTLDGSDPIFSSPEFPEDSILISEATVIRAKIYPLAATNYLSSVDAYGTYLFDIDHSTPILFITTQNSNLYGENGIFDNYNSDWIRAAHVSWLTKESDHPILFQTRTAMRMDGGAGGSRSNPQHSFRLTFDHSALGEETIHETLIPNIPFRDKYSEVYLRNGSNQWLTFPQKDACQVSMMSNGTNNYYSAMEPVTVYINGEYFGLYELREKFNVEFFDERENINEDSVEILSMSYFYNLILRALEGNSENFFNDYDAFNEIDPGLPDYMTLADQYFDLAHYTDYIIGESWMGNTDWPGNNIKIYRSDKTNYRWRFALIDLELSMNPNGWTNCSYNHIRYMLDQSTDNPYINIWLQSIQNTEYKNSFINRFADLMNTSYLKDTLYAAEQTFYDKMVAEMPNEYARWGDPFDIEGQMATFEQNHNTFQQQLGCRSNKVRGDLIEEFELIKEVEVTLTIFPDSAGTIKLNTIQPQYYPWEGTYFDGVPIKLTAVADSGYSFLHWLPNPFIVDTLNATFEINVDADETTFTAVFKLIPPPPDGETINFSLYPTPSSGAITIEHNNSSLAEGVTFEIYDLNGRNILKGKIDQSDKKTEINISTLNSALYFIKIYNDNNILDIIPFMKI